MRDASEHTLSPVPGWIGVFQPGEIILGESVSDSSPRDREPGEDTVHPERVRTLAAVQSRSPGSKAK